MPKTAASSYRSIESALLKSLRRSRSQRTISDALGYKINQYHRWETGRVRLKWLDFVAICEISNINLSQILKNCLSLTTDPRNSAEIFKRLITGRSTQEVAPLLNISAIRVRRVANGELDFLMDEFLRGIDLLLGSLVPFLDLLCGPKFTDNLGPMFRNRLKELHMSYHRPYTVAVMSSLRLRQYQELPAHQPGYVARETGISLAEERDILRELEAAGCIKMVHNKYVVDRDGHINLSGDETKFYESAAYWFQTATDSCRQPHRRTPGATCGYNVFEISEEGFRLIEKKVYEFFGAVQSIIDNDPNPKDVVGCLTMASFRCRDQNKEPI